MSAAPRSRVRLFNEIQGAVLSVGSLRADSSWSIFAVEYFGLVVTELRHVGAYSCDLTWLFVEVHHALAVLSASSCRSGFAGCDYGRIALVGCFMGANILDCARCFYKVKLAV